MICKSCGAKLGDGAYFCPECGMAVRRSEEAATAEEPAGAAVPTLDNIESEGNEMICPSCGARISGASVFCMICGNKIDSGTNESYLPTKKNSNSAWYIVGIAVGVIALFFVVAFISFSYFGNIFDKGDGNGNGGTAVATVAPVTNPPVTNPPVTEPPAPIAAGIERTDLYSPAYTYKRMDDIYSSVKTSDELYLEIKGVIEDFDRSCESYMNNGDTSVFRYLVDGTTAYSQQTSYKEKHPTLSQKYADIKVFDTREGSGYVYAWVLEVIDVVENGVSRRDNDRWVYKLARSGSGWVILDYTTDPAS